MGSGHTLRNPGFGFVQPSAGWAPYPQEPAFLARHPHVRVELGMNDKLVDLVADGIDVAIRIVPALKDTGLVARKLGSDRTVLTAAPAYLARRGTPSRPHELLEHDCLVYSLLKVADEWRFREPGSKEIFTLPVAEGWGRFSAASGAMIREAALAGMGLAVLPSFMIARHVAAGRLRQVLDSFAGVTLGVFAVYPQGPRPPSKVRALVDLLVAHFHTPRW